MEAEEVAPWIKYLLCKHEDWSLNVQHPRNAGSTCLQFQHSCGGLEDETREYLRAVMQQRTTRDSVEVEGED